MLAHFGVASVRLLTNNPAKVNALRKLGVHVVGRVPIVVAPNPHSSRYLEAKRAAHGARSARAPELRAASGDAE